MPLRLSCLLAVGLAFAASADGIVRTATDLHRTVYADQMTNVAFDITATIAYLETPSRAETTIMIVQDATGGMQLLYDHGTNKSGIRPSMGDIVHITGRTRSHIFATACAGVDKIEVIGRGRAITAVTATAEQIANGECELKPIVIEGILRDVFRDEIDNLWIYVILQSGSRTLYGAFPLPKDRPHGLERLIGSNVMLTGIPVRNTGSRLMIRTILYLNGPESVTTKTTVSNELFAVPDLEMEGKVEAASLDRFARRRIAGRVMATLADDKVLLRTEDGRIVRVKFATPNTPAYGASIEASGFPGTDIYRINLSCAVWRAANVDVPSEPPPEPISPAVLFATLRGTPGLNQSFNGKAVLMRGLVLDRPSEKDGTFNLDWEGTTVRIDGHAISNTGGKIEPGCLVEVSGVCVMEVPDWYPSAPFPHVEGFSIVMRTPRDLVVLARPPWWTPGRLATVIGALFIILFAVLLWNRSLRALAEKRGKAFANEELGRLASDLKASERTRLSVELHDSIAQNLSGVSMELDTALNGDEPLPPVAAQHLSRASKTLDSCRVELRNCIWDLRSHALDEADMDKAIRLALGPTMGKANLSVRFNVPRNRFTENTARTILNIVRELASNAVRHGHATEVRVAGSMDGETLRFSVRDNGCGFDPENRPGVVDGHFGLQGIMDRVAGFEGEIDISSNPGAGAKVTITFRANIDEDKEKI